MCTTNIVYEHFIWVYMSQIPCWLGNWAWKCAVVAQSLSDVLPILMNECIELTFRGGGVEHCTINEEDLCHSPYGFLKLFPFPIWYRMPQGSYSFRNALRCQNICERSPRFMYMHLYRFHLRMCIMSELVRCVEVCEADLPKLVARAHTFNVGALKYVFTEFCVSVFGK